MSNYVKTTSFGPKDSLPTGNPNKVIKGAEFDVEFDNIATAVATKADITSPAFTGTPTAPTAAAGTNTTQLATTAFIRQQLYAGSDIASAATITPPADGRSFLVTGTTTITTISSANSYTGRMLWLRFAGALTLTHSASLVLPGASNITTAAGDYGLFRCTGTDTWECVYWSTRARGDGSGLTNLNASNLTSGTVPDARFPSVLPAVSGANLTNLNASNLASGTVPSARMSGAYTGITSVAPALSQAELGVSAAAGSFRGFMFHTSGTRRWFLSTDDAAESGGNAGSNLALYRYSDAGSYISTVLSFDRASGAISVFGAPTFYSSIALGPMANPRLSLNNNSGTASTLQLGADSGNAFVGGTGSTLLYILSEGATRLAFEAGGRSRFLKGAYTDEVSIAFSATPTFDCRASNVFVFGALTGNVTSMTFSNQVGGQTIQIRFVQDATGGRTVALPAGAVVSGSINPAANSVTWLVMTYVSSAARWEGTWTRIS